jgi:hypothetical protein
VVGYIKIVVFHVKSFLGVYWGKYLAEFSGIGIIGCPRRDSSTMSHGVTRRRESPEKEAARKEKEKGQIVEYRALVQDVLTHVFPPSKPSTLKLSATQMTFPRKPSI